LKLKHTFYESWAAKINAWGTWFLCFEILKTSFGNFYGIKIFGLCLYVRWSLPDNWKSKSNTSCSRELIEKLIEKSEKKGVHSNEN